MDIDIGELAEIAARILRHVQEAHGTHIHLDTDFYWNIPSPDCYKPYEEPTNLDIGQLSDDWGELRRILNGEKEPLSYALVWLASVLRAVGEEAVS